MKFGSRSFKAVSDLETNKKGCDTFYDMHSFTSAEKKSTHAHKVMKDAESALKKAKKKKQDCICRTVDHHETVWKEATVDEFDKAWKKAHEVSCVLEGKMTCPTKCKVPAAPVLEKPKLHEEVEKARASCAGASPAGSIYDTKVSGHGTTTLKKVNGRWVNVKKP